MRTLSGTLAAELGLTLTRPGYLVELGFSSTMRLSTLGSLSYNGYSWYPADIKVAGLSRNEQGQQAGTLSIGNADLDYGALILSEGVADKTIRIWSVWAGAPSEAMPEFDGIGDDAEINGLRVTIKLSSGARRYAYSPRRIIGPQTGINVRLPAGTRITVGGMTVTLGGVVAMSYPNYDIRIGATSVPDTGREFARATNGALRGRSFFTASKRTFQITHVLTSTQLVAWRAYIAAMTTDTFVWPRDGLTYTVMLAGDPKETPLGGGVYTEVSLELREV